MDSIRTVSPDVSSDVSLDVSWETARRGAAGTPRQRGGGSAKDNKNLQTARNRLNIFLELIGDHPVDTYSGADLQAYVALMTHWPALERHRPPHMTPWEILVSNIDLKFRPLKRAPFENGYVSIVKAAIGWHTRAYSYPNPLAGVTLTYPGTAAPAHSAEGQAHPRQKTEDARLSAPSDGVDRMPDPVSSHQIAGNDFLGFGNFVHYRCRLIAAISDIQINFALI